MSKADAEKFGGMMNGMFAGLVDTTGPELVPLAGRAVGLWRAMGFGYFPERLPVIALLQPIGELAVAIELLLVLVEARGTNDAGRRQMMERYAD